MDSPPCPPLALRARPSRSRESPPQPAARWSLTLPLSLADPRGPGPARQALSSSWPASSRRSCRQPCRPAPSWPHSCCRLSPDSPWPRQLTLLVDEHDFAEPIQFVEVADHRRRPAQGHLWLVFGRVHTEHVEGATCRRNAGGTLTPLLSRPFTSASGSAISTVQPLSWSSRLLRVPSTFTAALQLGVPIIGLALGIQAVFYLR